VFIGCAVNSQAWLLLRMKGSRPHEVIESVHCTFNEDVSGFTHLRNGQQEKELGEERPMEFLEVGWRGVRRNENRITKDDSADSCGDWLKPAAQRSSSLPLSNQLHRVKWLRLSSQLLASRAIRRGTTRSSVVLSPCIASPKRSTLLSSRRMLQRAPWRASYGALDSRPRWRETQRGRRHTGQHGAQYYRRPTLKDGSLPPPPPPTPRARRKVVDAKLREVIAASRI
jgi:hypothetical protein